MRSSAYDSRGERLTALLFYSTLRHSHPTHLYTSWALRLISRSGWYSWNYQFQTEISVFLWPGSKVAVSHASSFDRYLPVVILISVTNVTYSYINDFVTGLSLSRARMLVCLPSDLFNTLWNKTFYFHQSLSINCHSGKFWSIMTVLILNDGLTIN